MTFFLFFVFFLLFGKTINGVYVGLILNVLNTKIPGETLYAMVQMKVSDGMFISGHITHIARFEQLSNMYNNTHTTQFSSQSQSETGLAFILGWVLTGGGRSRVS